jgi:chemotaxis protein histidine kinase CheA/ActR/RegA family two-component response regulator
MADWLEDEGLLETFRTEVEERLASLSQGLLSLEARPDDPEILAAIFRDAHTIKGSARMMGFGAVKEVAHRMEDVLGDIKEGRLRMTPAIADVLLAGVDLIPALVAPGGVSGELPPQAEDLVNRLESARGGLAPATSGAVPKAGSPVEWAPDLSAIGDGDARTPSEPVGSVEPSGHGAIGASVGHRDPLGTAPPRPSGLSQTDLVGNGSPGHGAHEHAVEERHTRPEPDGESVATASSIRIEAVKVYELIDLVGEASVGHVRSAENAKAMVTVVQNLEKRMRRLRDGRSTQVEDAREAMTEALAQLTGLLDTMEDAVSEEGRGLDRLQEQAMRLAMLPTSSIFAPYPRIVRDLCRDLGKEVDLHMDGGGTELDKQVLERIVDPIRHLLINAVDHGIETPAEREAAGKPRRGSLYLRARQQGRQVVMEVEDDGRGIDAQKVREAARRRGLLEADEDLPDAEVLGLLFQAGFSTSRLVTDLSGRGVGLDVVKTAVDRLKGAVEIQSSLGEGTRFLVTLPITLAIVEGVMVTCGGQTFAVPVSAVEEVVAVPAHELSRVGGRETAVLRGRTTPVVQLHRTLGLPPDEEPWGPVMVITTATRRIAFRVGSVRGQREVVIKGLGTFLPRVRHVAGATISGDGTVILVLDPFELVDAARKLTGSTPRAEEPQSTATGLRLLVIDDSLAIREMNRSILEAAGYGVETANDGLDGLNRLAQGGFQGVITDVEMPRMDGFELTNQIRSNPSLSHLPVIILTSLVRDEDRRRGLEVGADAYITKAGFDQNVLLDVIEGLVRAGGRRV